MHAKLSPSSAYRWLNCPGSVKLSQEAPYEEPSEYALEGTFAHGKGEYNLIAYVPNTVKTFYAPITYKGKKNKELTKAVNTYLNYAYDLIDASDHHLIEARVKYNKQIYGTADLICFDEMLNTLVVVDYKHGAGVSVDVVNNPQLIIYGLAALNHVTKPHLYHYITLAICQPRVKSGNKIKTWTVPIAELKEQWEPTINRAIKAVKNNPNRCIVGSHCRWCPGATLCPEQQKSRIDTAKKDFE